MPIASRTFRVFVSSTFEDLIEERNALQREVFPTLSAMREISLRLASKAPLPSQN